MTYNDFLWLYPIALCMVAALVIGIVLEVRARGKRLKEVEERLRVMEWELRCALYREAKAKNPDKKLLPPMPRFETHKGENVYDLKAKYWGCREVDY